MRSGYVDVYLPTLLRRLPTTNHRLPPLHQKQMKLNRRGKQVRAMFIYVLILTAIYAWTVSLGVWEIPESCLVEQVGCPEGYLP
jgi:hypothetical protein